MQSTVSVDWTDADLDGTFAAGERTGSIEYLIDNSNFTGYQQTILETVKNAAGQATKRTSYTFGVDEITQTTSIIDPSSQLITQSSTLTFAHDGHGSVRALFGAAAAIAQVFTYSAYGELLGIYNGSGTLQPLTSSLTSVLYNGEGFDARTGLYNFRARNYSASLGRFERLDPFSGNATDPFSFNKYGFVHGDPVQGIDPTGMFGLGASIGGISIATSLGTVYNGTVVEVGNYLANSLTGNDLAFDPFSYVAKKVWSLLPEGVKNAITASVNYLLDHFPALATAAAVVGMVLGPPGMRRSAMNQIDGVSRSLRSHVDDILGAILGGGRRLVRQIDLKQRIARISRFRDLGQGSGTLRMREAIGIARWEQATGGIAEESLTQGADFLANGKRVQLKGPILQDDGSPVPRYNLTSFIAQIENTAHGRSVQDIDEIVVDVLGLSQADKHILVVTLQASQPQFKYPVTIIGLND